MGKYDQLVWETFSHVSTIYPSINGAALFPRQDLVSEDGNIVLSMKNDGNLVVSNKSDEKVIWQTNTKGISVKGLYYHLNGNLVLYNSKEQPNWVPVWATNTGINVEKFTIQNDGRFVGLGKKNQIIWQTGASL